MPTPRMRLCRELDILAHLALHMGLITAVAERGEIWRINGQRAEAIDRRTGYGRVTVHTTPAGLRRQAMAHRIIWIAAHGIPPFNTIVCHINGHGWDNRLDNLTTRTEGGDVRPGRIVPYPATQISPATTP